MQYLKFWTWTSRRIMKLRKTVKALSHLSSSLMNYLKCFQNFPENSIFVSWNITAEKCSCPRDRRICWGKRPWQKHLQWERWCNFQAWGICQSHSQQSTTTCVCNGFIINLRSQPDNNMLQPLQTFIWTKHSQ